MKALNMKRIKTTVLDSTLPCNSAKDSISVFLLQNAKSKTKSTIDDGWPSL